MLWMINDCHIGSVLVLRPTLALDNNRRENPLTVYYGSIILGRGSGAIWMSAVVSHKPAFNAFALMEG